MCVCLHSELSSSHTRVEVLTVELVITSSLSELLLINTNMSLSVTQAPSVASLLMCVSVSSASVSGDLPEENPRRSLQSSDLWFQRLLPALQVSHSTAAAAQHPSQTQHLLDCAASMLPSLPTQPQILNTGQRGTAVSAVAVPC